MRWRVPISPAMVSSRSVAGDAEPPSETPGEGVSEGGQTALEWADSEAEKIGRIWLYRFPTGKDWA